MVSAFDQLLMAFTSREDGGTSLEIKLYANPATNRNLAEISTIL
jgi:hypothetical protein